MSKKKPKKQQPTKKPRVVQVQVTFDAPGRGTLRCHGDAMSFVGTDGRLVAPSKVEVASIYARDNGKSPKVMTRVPGDPSAISMDVNRVLAGFGSVFAVDTNTREIIGTRVSMSVMLRLTAAAPEAGAVEFHDARESPEHIGWYFAVRSIEASRVPGPVALVVDSDLDALPAINARERPYFADHLLPPGFTLVYASSDTGRTEFLGNKALAMCDSLATQALRQIEAGSGAGRQFHVDPSLPFARFHIWQMAATPAHRDPSATRE